MSVVCLPVLPAELRVQQVPELVGLLQVPVQVQVLTILLQASVLRGPVSPEPELPVLLPVLLMVLLPVLPVQALPVASAILLQGQAAVAA